MTQIEDVNIRLVLAELRPGVYYHWAGEGNLGNTMDAVREMANPPTEAEVIAKWDTIKDDVQSPPRLAGDRLAAIEEMVLDILLKRRAGSLDFFAHLFAQKRLSRADLKQLVESGQLTQAQADELINSRNPRRQSDKAE